MSLYKVGDIIKYSGRNGFTGAGLFRITDIQDIFYTVDNITYDTRMDMSISITDGNLWNEMTLIKANYIKTKLGKILYK